ncbi:hypothetical protein V1477_012843 [Vespula maculifrons]|uniref:Uncharacterized protein n=1 Tax=Vespula maculifrons TaxID=7453 RepID=A0ABD2BUP8_VESMC
METVCGDSGSGSDGDGGGGGGGGGDGGGGSVARILLPRQWSVGPKHQAGNEPHNAEVQAAAAYLLFADAYGPIDGFTRRRVVWWGTVGWNGSEDVGRRNTNRRESECWTYDRNYRSDLTLTVVQRAFDI